MRISIWQQFSSNHSASFQVVGRFNSVESAQQAAEILQAMLRLIIKARDIYEDEHLTQPEIEIAEKYQVIWEKPLDWVFDEEAHVIQLDEHVFCSNVYSDTHLGAHPMNQLMQKLGGEIAIYEEESGRLLAVEITCVAPNLSIANSIAQEVSDYLANVRVQSFTAADPPWHAFAQPAYFFINEPMWFDVAFFGYISQSDNHLVFSKMNFAEIGYGLPTLLDYLEARGCTDIEYHIEEKDYDEVHEGEPPE